MNADLGNFIDALFGNPMKPKISPYTIKDEKAFKNHDNYTA